MIPYGRQVITQSDVDAVVAVLRSDFLTQGPQVPLLERGLAEYCGASHAVAVNSATSALHIACLALGLSEGDWLWTTPTTFVASANCALYCGAKVDFVDIDPQTSNLNPQALEQKLIIAEREGRIPKIVIPVHLCGRPCDMQAIHALSKRFGFKIIEDASHAIGSRYRNEPVGNCRYSDITVFSFHPVKIITTAEGGAALTNHAELASKMALLRSHGITREPEQMVDTPDGPWYYEQIALGFNYRMTDLHAALGISQMARIDAFVAQRHQIAAKYDKLFVDLPVQVPTRDQDYSALHLYVIRLKLDLISRTHHDVFVALREQGIGVNLHYIPVHTHPYYREMGFAMGDFPEAERYYREAISLPIYPGLSDEDVTKVVNAVKIAISE
jgi:UDP-4-amino-4,6-dideoxy-N-acetyl-beta-L-altrosamine transaminase